MLNADAEDAASLRGESFTIENAMPAIEQLRFTVPEILSLIGLAQSVYVLVYMAFRSGDIRRALLPALYFLVLGTAFFLDFAGRFIGETFSSYPVWQWAAWFMGPPLSVLLIVQIAQITRMPSLLNLWVLTLVPAAWLAARLLAGLDSDCAFPDSCPVFREWLVVTGLSVGALSLLTIWAHRGLLAGLSGDRAGKDRYWLVLTLVFLNLSFLAVMLLSLTPVLAYDEVHIIRTVLGLGFVYLAGTSLFRIYPQAVVTVERRRRNVLSGEEQKLIHKIEELIYVDKIYHEPAYSRTDLAREVRAPETVISRLINDHFGKSLPQLLNERRVEDAKQLLVETDAAIKLIASEVGFNSTTSFNRAFREATGLTPSAFRSRNREIARAS